MTMNTTATFEDLLPSQCFTRILLQSGQYSSSTQPILESKTEKLLVQIASRFAEELVAKADLAAQRRTEHGSIQINDVEFVLKHHWPIYDSSSYDQIKKS